MLRVDVGAPIGMVIGVACKVVAIGSLRFPPRGPVLTQSAIALLRLFMRRKIGHGHLMLLQHL